MNTCTKSFVKANNKGEERRNQHDIGVGRVQIE